MKVCTCTTRNCGPNVNACGVLVSSAFWVRNGSLRVKLSNESVSMVTHDCDLEKLFPGNPLIEDNYLLILIFFVVNKYFKIKLQNITLGKVPLYYFLS